MVQEQAAQLDSVFHALADPTRRSMLRQLAQGERPIGELAEPYPMSFAAVSKHVRVLERVGLLRRRIEGRKHLCRIAPEPLAAASEWLGFHATFSDRGLDAPEAALMAADAGGVRGASRHS